MAKKEIAPVTCPQCGEEKGWRCTNAPDLDGDEPRYRKGFLYYLLDHMGLLGLFGQIAMDAAHDAKKAHYHCDKCGYEEKYDFD